MRIDSKLFQSLPILAAIRDRNGRVLDATDRLLAESGLKREEAIGKRSVALWPSWADSVPYDALALKTGKPVTRIERSERSGRWYRSTHTPEGDCVIWIAEDASAEVEIRALKVIIGARKQRLETPPVAIGRSLLSGSTLPGICGALSTDAETALSHLVNIVVTSASSKPL